MALAANVSLPTAAPERASQRRLGERAALVGAGRSVKDGQGIHTDEIIAKRLQRLRVVLAQCLAMLVCLALTRPNHGLVGSSQHLDRLGQLAIGRH